jgi:hypothetical protein
MKFIQLLGNDLIKLMLFRVRVKYASPAMRMGVKLIGLIMRMREEGEVCRLNNEDVSFISIIYFKESLSFF